MAVLRPDAPAQRGQLDTERIADLATSQYGVISRKQLLIAGFSESRIDRWLTAGRIHPIHPGVYALGHSALSLNGRLNAALRYGGDEAVFSHTTAGWIWSLLDAEPKRIHLTVPGRRSSLPEVRVHSRRNVARFECRDLPVTSVPRTLVDLAAILSFGELRRALAEADFRGLLSVEEVTSMCSSGRAGSRALRQALAKHLPELAQTLSVLEERFLALCEAADLPLPEVNAKVGGMRVDALWPEHRLAVELDGAAAHGGWAQVSRDRKRELALRRLGFRVVRYTWQQITERPTDVIADLGALLGIDGITPSASSYPR